MLNWTFTFLILAMIAGVLGFSNLAGSAAGIAQILCGIFLILSAVSLMNQELHRRNL